MTFSSFRAFLLVTSALTLLGCDDKPQDNQTAQEDSGVQITYPEIIGTNLPSVLQIRKTEAGSFLSGQHAQTVRDWDKASGYFEDILADAPDNPEIRLRVMALSLGSGNYDRAVAMARKVIETDKNETLAQMLAALHEFKTGQYKQAEERISSVPQDGLGAAVMPLVKAWCEAAQGKTSLDTLKTSPSFLYQTVLIADYTGDDAAVRKLAATYDFTKTPAPISGLEQIADVFARHGEQKSAKTIYTALRQALPERAAQFDEKLKALANQKTEDTAVKAEAITPQQGLASALLDTARLLANGYEESAVLFTHMSRFLDGNRSDTLELLAQFSADNKRYQSAIDYLSKIDTANDPEQAKTIRRQIAMLLELDNQNAEAVRVLQDLVEQNGNVDAQIQIGDIYRQSEDYKNALAAYNKAAEMLGDKIPQDHWQLLFSRGIAHERLSQWDKAEQDLKEALVYEPDQPYVLNYLGYTWADHGQNLDKAAEMIAKAARLKPDDGAIIDSLGWVYYRMGKYADAVKVLENAVELQPYEAEINDHLGDAYWQVGRRNEARFQWKRAISFTKDETVINKINDKIENGLEKPLVAGAAKMADKLVDNQ